MEMFMKEIGSMTKLMVVEPTFTWTVLNIKVTGERTSNTGSVLRHGLMVQDMKETMSTERNTVLELSNGQMVQCISESFTIITFTEKECTHGVTVENTRVNGVTTRCMARELSPGQMVGSTSENTSMIRSKAMESSYGLMADATKETGTTENNMARVYMSQVRVPRNTESGKKARESDGLERMNEALIERSHFLFYKKPGQ
jgi:hypothetical protein